MIEIMAAVALGGLSMLAGVVIGHNLAMRGQAFPSKGKADYGD